LPPYNCIQIYGFVNSLDNKNNPSIQDNPGDLQPEEDIHWLWHILWILPTFWQKPFHFILNGY